MFSDDIPSLIINDGIQGSFHSLYFKIENRPVHFFRPSANMGNEPEGFCFVRTRVYTPVGNRRLGETRNTSARILLASPADCKLATTVDKTGRVGVDRFLISTPLANCLSTPVCGRESTERPRLPLPFRASQDRPRSELEAAPALARILERPPHTGRAVFALERRSTFVDQRQFVRLVQGLKAATSPDEHAERYHRAALEERRWFACRAQRHHRSALLPRRESHEARA